MDVVLLTCIERPDRDYSDLDRACILARSLERNLDPTDRWPIHVVAADSEIETVRDMLSRFSLDYRFHPHSAFFSGSLPADGWRIQQFLKLLISRTVSTDFYLSIDSDQILTRRLRESDLVRDGRAIYTPEPRERHEEWWIGSAEILGTAAVTDPVSAMSCVCMSTSVVRRLLDRLVARFGEGWKDSLLARKDWIEYSLYFTFAQAQPVLPHFAGPLLGTEQSIWYPDEVEVWDAENSFDKDHFFICLQSSVNLPPEMIWSMIERYLEVPAES